MGLDHIDEIVYEEFGLFDLQHTHFNLSYNLDLAKSPGRFLEILI